MASSRLLLGNQVSSTDMDREVNRKANAHDEVDHGDRRQSQVPEVHEAKDAHQDHDNSQHHQQDHGQVRQEDEGDHSDSSHGAADQL